MSWHIIILLLLYVIVMRNCYLFGFVFCIISAICIHMLFAGNLLTVPLTVVAAQTLQRYMQDLLRRGSYLLTAHTHSAIENLRYFPSPH